MRLSCALVAVALLCAACTSSPPAERPNLPSSTTPLPERTDHGSMSREVGKPTIEVAAEHDFWAELRTTMVMPDVAQLPDVREQIAVLQRDRHFTELLASRGARLLPMIFNVTRARGVPGEVVLLPYIESKLDVDASHAGNVGMWQIRAGTAVRNGLRVDVSRDERRDPVKSTAAACSYLLRMARMFDDDWSLALTAYNIGDGGLRAVLAAAPGNRDIWTLPLANGVRQHMAKLAALSAVVRDPDRYGVRLPPITITGTRTVSTPERPSMNSSAVERRYRVQPGDTLHAIAKTNGVTVDALQRANGLRDSLIHPGDALLIPTGQ